ncbi:MAG: alpha/beta hydrolase [Candidatus Eremiobacteraeota bacterium]|nr:alpha/beta hydrolase [Candidatus Eremiobacteraeota bacterium]
MKCALPIALFGLAMCLASLPASAFAAVESDIVLKTATGNIDGTLMLAGKRPSPIVLIIAGSGPTDRNGNSLGLTTDAYKLLAADLARVGISSVRYDKRGIGASKAAGPPEQDLRFETYVNDAVDWTNLLHADSRFSRVVIAGHSEGSLIGIVASQRAPVSALVSLEGAGRPAATVLREQLKPKLSADLYAKADAALTLIQAGHSVTDTPPQLAALFRPSVQPYLISWLKYDPAVEIAKLHIPVTIVQGTADIQVSMEDAIALKSAGKSFRFLVIHGMNHVLKHAPNTSTQAAIAKGYTDPALSVEANVVRAITDAAQLGH